MAKNQDKSSTILGVLTFLAGIALLILTFYMAYQLYYAQPALALVAQPKESIDLNKIGNVALQLLGTLLFKSMMLIIMSIIGSLIAHRGIKLYMASHYRTSYEDNGD